MRVLVTRPLKSAERTAGRLREMGHEPLLLPLAEPKHETARALQAMAETDGAIAMTSAEAVRTFHGHTDDLAPHLDRPLFAVGEATAEEATAAGFRRVTASSGNGRDLAEQIAGHGFDRALYLAGAPRAATFEHRADELGLRLTVVEAYAMRPLAISASTIRDLFARRSPEIVLFYSRQTAQWFFDQPEIAAHLDRLANTRLLALAEPVAAAVPKALRKNIVIAAMPDEQSLLSLLQIAH
ncbi:uroporphyrinogen-III synthase [Rhizobium sp. S152]|uniref:uroporphyrinogen-III synthase n=1 Tax=Rhizobium sp. S152 TaxID=3055038 RepID=UPI0025A99AC1|nr:uroporphyrinogen-III synthase [Rhizobium sp. S152]MDM9627317.1 uroporphyrinogen-III synthase [Rhizobium sp. S152]